MSMNCDPETKSWEEMGLKEKLTYFLRNITVEPILLCFMLANTFVITISRNLKLERACMVNLINNITSDICDMIKARNGTDDIQKYEEQLQVYVNSMTYWQSVVRGALPLVLVLFLGSFSDRSGRRKPFILLPIAAELFTTAGLMLCIYFESWPVEMVGLIEAIFPALVGGSTTMIMGLLSYMGDLTSVDSRTVRLGIFNIFLQGSGTVANLIGGYLYNTMDYMEIFSISFAIYFLGLIYGVVRLKEVKKPNKLKHNVIKELTNPDHLIDIFQVFFKSRRGTLRLRIILVMFLSVTIIGPLVGEGSVLYLYTVKRFRWDSDDFAYYSAYGTIVNTIGISLAMELFTHRMKMDDAMLGIIACVSKIVAFLFYPFAKTTKEFCLVTLIELVGTTSLVATRSIALKLVPSEEFGKINSISGFCEAVVPLAFPHLYTFIYNNTIHTLPGAFLLMSSFLTVPAVFIFLYLYYLNKNDPLSNERSNNEELNEAKTNQGFDMTEETLETPVNTKL